MKVFERKLLIFLCASAIIMSETINIIQKRSNIQLEAMIMLTEERYTLILERVKQNKSVKLPELCQLLEASESTVRRDLAALDEKGLIK
ncbi:MAG: DeoR family transcriptional regulator, partial [Acutalibacteraceae bacterium]|nr:DeoR family transcriptional regulator [Acutalibacteraceae bacterium]